jgi:hypothetical protein
MPKTVPSSKFREWQGLDRISLIVHEMKCIFREINKDDFGIDGEIEIVVPKPDGDGYQTTGNIIKVQAKSGMSYVKQDSETNFVSPVSKDDLETWYSANCPTIFIIYHPEDDKLYWKEIQSYVKNTPNVWQPPYKITFNKVTDEFTYYCFQSIRSLASVTASPRISFTEQERLFSNLLRLRKVPKMVWSASTPAKDYDEIRLSIQGFVPPFVISAGRIYSFSNLNRKDCVLKAHCKTDIQPERVESWWSDEAKKRDYVFCSTNCWGYISADAESDITRNLGAITF